MNLQTKTTNQVAVKKDNGKRNFFQKTVILLAILAFTGFGFKAKAQTKISLDVDNQTNCTWIVKCYDGSLTPVLLASWTVGPGHPTPQCFTPGVLTTTSYITVTDWPSPTCTTLTFTSPYTNSTQSTSCGGPPPVCSTGSVNCSGGTTGILCSGGPNDFFIIVIN